MQIASISSRILLTHLDQLVLAANLVDVDAPVSVLNLPPHQKLHSHLLLNLQTPCVVIAAYQREQYRYFGVYLLMFVHKLREMLLRKKIVWNIFVLKFTENFLTLILNNYLNFSVKDQTKIDIKIKLVLTYVERI